MVVDLCHTIGLQERTSQESHVFTSSLATTNTTASSHPDSSPNNPSPPMTPSAPSTTKQKNITSQTVEYTKSLLTLPSRAPLNNGRIQCFYADPSNYC